MYRFCVHRRSYLLWSPVILIERPKVGRRKRNKPHDRVAKCGAAAATAAAAAVAERSTHSLPVQTWKSSQIILPGDGFFFRHQRQENITTLVLVVMLYMYHV